MKFIINTIFFVEEKTSSLKWMNQVPKFPNLEVLDDDVVWKVIYESAESDKKFSNKLPNLYFENEF